VRRHAQVLRLSQRLVRRLRSLRALAATLLPLVLAIALPGCTSTTVCTAAAAAMLPAPTLTASGDTLYAATNGALSALHANTGSLAWHAPTGSGGFEGPTSPLATGGVVLVGTGLGKLTAFRASDGSVAWHAQPVPRSASDISSPRLVLAPAADVVYAAASPDSIAAWRVADGTLLWQSPFLAVPADPYYVSSYEPLPEPVVSADAVYFSAGQSVHAVRTSDGSLLWSSPALQSANLYSPPVLADGRLFVAMADGSLAALEAGTGAVLWRATDPGAIPSRVASTIPAPPIVRDGAVYYTPFNGLRTLDAGTGRLLWQRAFDDPSSGPAPQIEGGMVYLATGGAITGLAAATSVLLALNAQTGAPKWRVDPEAGDGVPFLVTGDTVYTMSASAVAAWRASDGASLWQRTVRSGASSLRVMIFADGTLYLSMNGLAAPCGGDPLLPTASALRASDGALLWRTSVPVS
jgi:outer membrane protein assembly factor BamB